MTLWGEHNSLTVPEKLHRNLQGGIDCVNSNKVQAPSITLLIASDLDFLTRVVGVEVGCR